MQIATWENKRNFARALDENNKGAFFGNHRHEHRLNNKRTDVSAMKCRRIWRSSVSMRFKTVRKAEDNQCRPPR